MTNHIVTKECTRCKLSLPEDQFNFKIKSKGIRETRCKKCVHTYARAHYRKNKQQYLRRNRDTHKRNRDRVLAMKEKPCTDCERTYPTYVMEFDHNDPAIKEFAIGKSNWGWYKKIARELEKVDLVCSNCHKMRTHNRKYADQGLNP